MHQYACFPLAIVLFAGTSLLAQTQSQPTGQPNIPQAGEALTGCLRSSPSGTSAADARDIVYTLEQTETATDKPSTTPGAAAAPPSGGSSSKVGSSSKTVYTLAAPASVGLARHVGHEVQLTGRMQPAPAQSGASGAQDVKPGGAHNTFQVSALKMVSMNCP
jgi:hypothetical protein